MNDQDIAINLLKRLIDGERGLVPMHLGMILERSSALANSDSHYQKILPTELAELRLTLATRQTIVDCLCLEISRNPDEALIAAVSTSGSEPVTKLITEILINPPRPLTLSEYSQALGIAYGYLPSYLERNPQFLGSERRSRLIQQLQSLQKEGDKATRRQARRLLEKLTPTEE